MKLLRRHSGKPLHINFVLYVETLSPWPTKYGTLAVQWQRGKRSGQTKPATPSNQGASTFSSYSFRETITLPATIYRSGEGFEAKECSLFIAQVDGKGKEIEILGAIEFSLTDFMNQSISRQSLHIECSPSIWAPAGGRPTLTIGIGVSREGGDVGRVAEELQAYCALDEADIPSRLSTDDEASRPSSRTGSRSHFGDVAGGEPMIQSVQPRAGYDSQSARVNEPKLQNNSFSNHSTLTTAQVVTSTNTNRLQTIEYDEDGILIDSDLLSGSEKKAEVVEDGLTKGMRMELTKDEPLQGYKEDEKVKYPYGQGNKPEEDFGGNQTKKSQTDEEPKTAFGVKRSLERQLSEISGGLQRPYGITQTNTENSIGIIRRFSSFGDGNIALGSKSWAWKRQNEENESSTTDTAEDRKARDDTREQVQSLRATSMLSTFSVESKEPAISTLSAEVSLGGADSGVEQVTRTIEDQQSKDLLVKYVEELQTTAALESAVYLAGLGWMGSSEDSPPLVTSLQAPARRIARTVIILGPEKGMRFGHQAISAIQSAASAALDDPHRLTVWWVNTVLLRWSFWALSKSDPQKAIQASRQNNNFEWLTLHLAPSLLDLESRLFADLVEQLWQCVVYTEALKSVVLAEKSNHTSPRSVQIKDKGDAPRSNGKHVEDIGIVKNLPEDLEELVNIDKVGSAAKHWIAGLQGAYVAITPEGRPPAGPRPLVSTLWKQILLVLLRRMDEQLLKGIVEREETDDCHHASDMQESEKFLFPFSHGPLTFSQGAEMKVIAGRLSAWAADSGIRDAGKLFPMLRAAANLLMLPKGGFIDGDVRDQVVGVLPSAAIARILQRYVSTNGPIDNFSPGLLRQLRAEAASCDTQMDEWWKYEPTSNESLLQQGVVQPFSLDMNPDSDDELSGLEDRAAGQGGAVARYQLLRQLWKTAGRGVFVGEEI